MSISPHAIVSPDADVHPSVVVEPYAIIHSGASVGANTHIHSHAVVRSDTRLGEGCEVHTGAVLGGDPQDLKYDGEQTELIIGDRTIIREYVTINRGTRAQGYTHIGSDTLIMAYCHVAHDCIIGDHVVLANAVNLAGHVCIDDYTVVGGMSAVQQFVKIGESAYIGGGSMIRKDIPPYIKAAREPLAYIGVNTIGLERRGWSKDRIGMIQSVYDRLMVKSKNLAQGLRELPVELTESDVGARIISFISNSRTGLVRGYRGEGDED